MSIQLSVIGLGKIGTSIGLALKNYSKEIFRTGFDRHPSIAKKAFEMKAFDKIESEIDKCVSSADIVILALPIDEIIITLDTIIPYLQPNSVLIDTSPIKIKVSEYVDEKLPDNRYFVSLFPTINPEYLSESDLSIENAHEDLFHNSLMVITNSSKTNNEALKLGADLSKYLGAKILFADPFEIDGLLAATELLPNLISAAYIHAVMNQPGWKEGRKLTNSSFYSLSNIISFSNEREEFGESAFLNKENVRRVLMNMINSLRKIEKLLEEEDLKAVRQWHQQSIELQKQWVEERVSSSWNKEGNLNLPSSRDFMKNIIGFGNKRKDKKDL